MTPNETLVKFMEYKSKKVSTREICYFTEKDEENILKWPSNQAQAVVNKIVGFIELCYNKYNPAYFEELSDGDLCPFCQMYEFGCSRCEYMGEHGGSCLKSDDSDYKKLVQIHGEDLANLFGKDEYDTMLTILKIKDMQGQN